MPDGTERHRAECEDSGVRMLLTSNGPRNDVTRDALTDLLGMPIADARIAVVIDAILPFAGDSTTLLEHLSDIRALGWAEFDVVSLLAAPRPLVEARLRSAEVVLGYGGSNHWLAHAWRATGLDAVLPELLDEKVYVGWSAGSMIFSRRQAAAAEVFGDDELRLFGLDSTTPAAPLFDWFLMPHLGAPYFPDSTDEWATERAAMLGGPSWFLDDESALLVRDPAIAPEAVSSGHWLHFDATGRLIGSQ
jgi:dipeptidase E